MFPGQLQTLREDYIRFKQIAIDDINQFKKEFTEDKHDKFIKQMIEMNGIIDMIEGKINRF